jgi:hypothetical protein
MRAWMRNSRDVGYESGTTLHRHVRDLDSGM